ncbi:hypothetical protein MHW47_00035 [Streptomyces sp. OfavH-34-F]|uniref:hypothetical protein n=1 Tax=Streptomyces sp. OfavH-34-F TaxID=2917760 RepID=UPI001EF33449|nr:hypothetical protein [Streptomyces sp. OfavH-34-F]MCG7522843.1 hypothetical protein [Streptomyces sp. OfavH-34-F]
MEYLHVFTDRPHLAYLGPCDPARPQPGRAPDEEADRLENTVLSAYLAHLEAEGHRVVRHRVVTAPELASTDLVDATTDELVMAWHRTHYLALIAALGVISDCARLFPRHRRALLLTTAPGTFVQDFLSYHKIIAIWPENGVFVRAEPEPEGSAP